MLWCQGNTHIETKKKRQKSELTNTSIIVASIVELDGKPFVRDVPAGGSFANSDRNSQSLDRMVSESTVKVLTNKSCRQKQVLSALRIYNTIINDIEKQNEYELAVSSSIWWLCS
jgi:hypothetical protein